MADIPAAVILSVQGDALRLRQIWRTCSAMQSNLPSRARLRGALSSAGARGDPAGDLECADTGIGIPPRPRCGSSKDPPRQMAPPVGKYGGTGWAGHSAGKLAEMMGGELLLDSRPGRGRPSAFETSRRAVTGLRQAVPPSREGRVIGRRWWMTMP